MDKAVLRELGYGWGEVAKCVRENYRAPSYLARYLSSVLSGGERLDRKYSMQKKHPEAPRGIDYFFSTENLASWAGEVVEKSYPSTYQ